MQDRMQSDSRLLGLVYGAVFGSLFPLFHFAARSFARLAQGVDQFVVLIHPEHAVRR